MFWSCAGYTERALNIASKHYIPKNQRHLQPAHGFPYQAQEAKIQQILDNLDERLASVKISEATYDRLRAKWEKKLAGQ